MFLLTRFPRRAFTHLYTMLLLTRFHRRRDALWRIYSNLSRPDFVKQQVNFKKISLGFNFFAKNAAVDRIRRVPITLIRNTCCVVGFQSHMMMLPSWLPVRRLGIKLHSRWHETPRANSPGTTAALRESWCWKRGHCLEIHRESIILTSNL